MQIPVEVFGRITHPQVLQVLPGAGPRPEALRTTSRCHAAVSREFVLMNCLSGDFGQFWKDFGSLVGIFAVSLGSSVTGQVT